MGSREGEVDFQMADRLAIRLSLLGGEKTCYG